MSTVKQRVAKGARFLDKEVGKNWHRKVKITKLDIRQPTVKEDGCGCVLAQLSTSGSYWKLVNDLGLNGHDTQDLGFDGYCGFYDPIWDLLEEAWKNEIRSRRNSDEKNRTRNRRTA